MKWTIGIDEVGRGPLAGPVTVCAVATSMHPRVIAKILNGIKDSKKLSQKQKEEWRAVIRANEKFFIAVTSVRAASIDKNGMSYAARKAVARCLQRLESHLEARLPSEVKILLDGSLYAPPFYTNQETIIKGDEKIPLIAAASIMAKLYRDRHMVRLAKQFPQYQFDVHKGYGTKLHRSLIRKHGLSKVHRKTFCTKLI